MAREYHTRYDEPISMPPDVDELVDKVRAALSDRLTDESRWALLNAITNGWCIHCGSTDVDCYCQADD